MHVLYKLFLFLNIITAQVLASNSTESILGFVYDIDHIQKLMSLKSVHNNIIIPQSLEQKIKQLDSTQELKLHVLKDYWNGEGEIKALEIYKSQPYNRVVALGEFDVLRAARIRSTFNLQGQHYESALHYRDKFKFFKQLVINNIPVPISTKVTSVLDLTDFAQKYQFPIIIKPRRSASSMGITKIQNDSDLLSFIAKEETLTDFHEAHFIAQEFIYGNLYHINGITKGEECYSWPSIYTVPNLEMLNGKVLGTFLMDKDNPLCQPLIELSCNVIKALPLPTGSVFHIELFNIPNTQNFYVLEAGCRPAGGCIMSDWISGFKIDLVEEMMCHQLGRSTNTNYNFIKKGPKILVGSLEIPAKKGIIKSIPLTCPLECVGKYTVCKNVGDSLKDSDATDTAIANFSEIKGTNEQEIRDKFKIIEKWFYQNFLVE